MILNKLMTNKICLRACAFSFLFFSLHNNFTRPSRAFLRPHAAFYLYLKEKEKEKKDLIFLIYTRVS